MFTIKETATYLENEGLRPRTLTEVLGVYEDISEQPFPNKSAKYDAFSTIRLGMPCYDWSKCIDCEPFSKKLMFLQEILAPLDGKVILDAGCATGLESVFLGKQVGSGWVYGIDFSTGMIARAWERQQRHPNTRTRFGVADMTNLPFSSNSFDAAMNFRAIGQNEIDPTQEELYALITQQVKELRRVTKYDGKVVFNGGYNEDEMRERCATMLMTIGRRAGLAFKDMKDFGYHSRDGEHMEGDYIITFEKI